MDGSPLFCWCKFIFSTVTAPAGPRSDDSRDDRRRFEEERFRSDFGDQAAQSALQVLIRRLSHNARIGPKRVISYIYLQYRK